MVLRKKKKKNCHCNSRAHFDKMRRLKTVKNALGSRKLSELTVERKAQMSNMEELISRGSRKTADGAANELLLRLLQIPERLLWSSRQHRLFFKVPLTNH